MRKNGRGRHSEGKMGHDRKDDDRRGDEWKTEVICHRCGVMGHIKLKCSSKHKWASDETFKSDGNLASNASISAAESETVHFLVIHSDPVPDSTPDSVITVNVALAYVSADYWILETGATNHGTGNCHLFETIHTMAKGEHQVMTANNSVVDAEGSATITFHVERPNAKPPKIILQHVLYVAACGTNNVLVQSRRMSLHGETGSFTEPTPVPHLHDWTGSFAERTYKLLITPNVVVQLQLHRAPYPDLNPALLPRCPIALHRPLPPLPFPSRLHPCTPQDTLLPQYQVLSNHFHRFPLRSY